MKYIPKRTYYLLRIWRRKSHHACYYHELHHWRRGDSINPVCRCPDITRARERLGWEPKVDLEEGLKLTIPYFKRELGLE